MAMLNSWLERHSITRISDTTLVSKPILDGISVVLKFDSKLDLEETIKHIPDWTGVVSSFGRIPKRFALLPYAKYSYFKELV